MLTGASAVVLLGSIDRPIWDCPYPLLLPNPCNGRRAWTLLQRGARWRRRRTRHPRGTAHPTERGARGPQDDLNLPERPCSIIFREATKKLGSGSSSQRGRDSGFLGAILEAFNRNCRIKASLGSVGPLQKSIRFLPLQESP